VFARQTITKDPISVTPSVFDILLLLGWFSDPVAINVTGNSAVLDSTAWHVVGSLSVTPSTPELLLIPWVANAVGSVAANSADLTDSLLLGDAHVNIILGISGFTGAGSELAPSWYIRQPYKNNYSFPFDATRNVNRTLSFLHEDAPIKNTEKKIIPWGTFDGLSKVISGAWSFLEKIDVDTEMGYEKFLDEFYADVTQTYSYPEIKDVEDSINWDEFLDQFIKDVSYRYFYPDVKDIDNDIPWNKFGSIFNSTWGLDYSHPPFKDVFKIITSGPNWYPKYCEHQHSLVFGDLVLNWITATHQPYAQYFDTSVFPINQQPPGTLPPQAEILPQSDDRASMYPSGSMFSGRPIAQGDSQLQMRGHSGGRLNVEIGYLLHPIYFNDHIADYPLVCYDGYRNGPKDSTEKVPYFPVVLPDIRSYYIVMNTVSMKLVSDNTVIPISSLSIGTDMDSWCWTIRAELRRKVDLDLVTPVGSTPVEVEVLVNGNIWRFIIENFGESRQFGQSTYQISGRTPSAALASPYSAPASFRETSISQAVQLADQAVAGTGYTITWGLTDWLVPAEVYSVVNATPMQQLLKIANAAGGVVHSDPAATTISLLPWYSVVPWSWGGATVDAALPTYSSKSSQHESKHQYNGAYVSGETQGVTCLIKRTGTDGADQPQMQVDPLITATEAGLQRGTKILADSGNRSLETLEAPLFDNPGLLTPGMLISVTDKWETWKGKVISVQINARRPIVNQTLGVLRYHGT